MTDLEIKFQALYHIYKKGLIDRKEYRDYVLQLVGVKP